jgi:hypothetical protein
MSVNASQTILCAVADLVKLTATLRLSTAAIAEVERRAGLEEGRDRPKGRNGRLGPTLSAMVEGYLEARGGLTKEERDDLGLVSLLKRHDRELFALLALLAPRIRQSTDTGETVKGFLRLILGAKPEATAQGSRAAQRSSAPARYQRGRGKRRDGGGKE